jgi:hypothetical protein
MKKSFGDWVKLREQLNANMNQNQDVSKKDDKSKMNLNIKNALVGAMKQKQDPEKAVQNVAQQTAMNPNSSPDDILAAQDVIDKINKKKNPMMGQGQMGQMGQRK